MPSICIANLAVFKLSIFGERYFYRLQKKYLFVFNSQSIEITSVATNRYTSVASLMKKDSPFIDHQYDVSHSVTKS